MEEVAPVVSAVAEISGFAAMITGFPAEIPGTYDAESSLFIKESACSIPVSCAI